jgi:type I restriction enzyme S subunit
MVNKMDIPKGFKETEVGVIPEDWEVKKISSFSEIVTGSTPPTYDKSNYGNEYFFVSPSDLGKSRLIQNTEKKLSPKGFNLSRKFPKDSILFTCIGSTIGKSGIASKELTSNQQINAILPNKYFNSDFLYFILNLFSEKIKKSAGETAVPIINKTEFGEVAIPLPPTKTEQTAIATALNDADGLITQLEKLIAKKRAVKEGAMQVLLQAKEGWEVKRLREVFKFLRTANNSRADLMEDGTIEYIHYGDIHTKWNSFLDCSKQTLPFISEDKILGVPLLRNGDLVIADASEDYEGLGACIELINIGNRKIVAGLHTLLLRGNKEIIADGFKGYLKKYQGFQEALIALSTGVSVYGISKSKLKEIEINIPPIAEQTRIAHILSDMDAEIGTLEGQVEKWRGVKAGMMQVLLTGKIRLV